MKGRRNIGKFNKDILPKIFKRKIKEQKETIDHVVNNIRTDSYDCISIKDLRGTAENYRIEATGLLDAIWFLYTIADELDKMAKEKEEKCLKGKNYGK